LTKSRRQKCAFFQKIVTNHLIIISPKPIKLAFKALFWGGALFDVLLEQNECQINSKFSGFFQWTKIDPGKTLVPSGDILDLKEHYSPSPRVPSPKAKKPGYPLKPYLYELIWIFL
jgi:hypothetical protein